MSHLQFSTHKRFVVIIALFIFFSAPLGVNAVGLSPPEVEFEYIPVGTTQTVSAWISRSVDEMSGDLHITVTPRKSAAGFFFGASEFTIPEGTREIEYLYSIIPSYAQQAQQELYVTFLLQLSTASFSGVSIVTGITQVVRFQTDVSSSQTLGTVSGGTSGGSGSTTQDVPGQDQDDSTSSDTSQTDTSLDDGASEDQTGQEDSIPASLHAPDSTISTLPTDSESSDASQKDVEEERPLTVLDKLSTKEIDSSEESSVRSKQEPLFVNSSTHPLSERYYSSSQVMLSWREPGNYEDTTFRFILNQNSLASDLELIYQTKNPSIIFNLSDGIYYFHILDESRPFDGVQTRRVMVDTTPPVVVPSVEFHSFFPLLTPHRFITLEIIDALAGVSDVWATINGTAVLVSGNRISMRGLGFGTHTLTVQATDLAGNIVDKTFAVDVVPKYPIAQTVTRVKEALLNKPFSFFTR